MILALDPSTSALGWAVGDGGRVVRAGVILGRKKDDWIIRCRRMSSELTALLGPEGVGYDFPDRVLIESPDGKIHARAKGSGGSGASKYGFAVGMFYGAFAAHDVPVDAISVNLWTRGRPKERRAKEIELIYPEIDFGKDPGLDAHDAAAMLEWWFCEERAKGCVI